MIMNTAYEEVNYMKLARLICPGCRSSYEQAITREAYYVSCPNCGQNNNIPEMTPTITGLCLNCEKPLDDHIWQGEIAAHCP
jgi:hypothetical protein